MKFEGNLARQNIPVFDDNEMSEGNQEKERLNLQNLALEKIEKGEISETEKLECFKILFEQNPDLAMELAKKEKIFPLTALVESGFFYFQKEASSRFNNKIISLIFKK